MKKNDIEYIQLWHATHREKNLDSRYLNLRRMQPYLEELDDRFHVRKIGESFEGRDICELVFGTGPIHILLWTQMHGNESTGTRALLDLVKFIGAPDEMTWLADLILKQCTVYCIPMLNPDGAEVYTRINAQKIDLNRDVIDLKAPESILLQERLKNINPAYCFNLHDQRTIFSIAPNQLTATMSFLAPSVDQQRSLTEGRKETMRVIACINNVLQKVIPGRIGRYTDEFYPTATGDNFQKMGHNTILIESGHSQGDYMRKESRFATFLALLEGMRHIAMAEVVNHDDYFKIPDNEKKYLDAIIRGCNIGEKKSDVGVLFIEKLVDQEIVFDPSIHQIDHLEDYNADEIINGKSLYFTNEKDAEKWIKNRYN